MATIQSFQQRVFLLGFQSRYYNTTTKAADLRSVLSNDLLHVYASGIRHAKVALEERK